MYYGNNGTSLSIRPRAFRADLATPLQPDCGPVGEAQFGISLLARSPGGRARARLVWETRAQGQEYSHSSPITNSTEFTATQATFTQLAVGGSTLTQLVDKAGFRTKVRARVEFHPADRHNGQVFGPWVYFNNAGVGSGVGVILPIEGLTLTGHWAQPGVAQLDWHTLSETNLLGYALQHSPSLGGEWHTVAFVPGGGGAYTHPHPTAAPHNYYRVVATDPDGTTHPSNVVELVQQPGGGAAISIHPNPTTGYVHINGLGTGSRVQVYSLAGALLLDAPHTPGTPLDANALPAGVYLLRMTDAATGHTTSTRLVRQ